MDREEKITIQDVIDIVNDITWSDNGRHYPYIPQARNMRILALEKQVPMKVTDERYCPNCDEAFFDSWQPDYCPVCGQSLDWGDFE